MNNTLLELINEIKNEFSKLDNVYLNEQTETERKVQSIINDVSSLTFSQMILSNNKQVTDSNFSDLTKKLTAKFYYDNIPSQTTIQQFFVTVQNNLKINNIFDDDKIKQILKMTNINDFFKFMEENTDDKNIYDNENTIYDLKNDYGYLGLEMKATPFLIQNQNYLYVIPIEGKAFIYNNNFTTFLNDINIVFSQTLLFTDDSTLIFTSSSVFSNYNFEISNTPKQDTIQMDYYNLIKSGNMENTPDLDKLIISLSK